MVGVGALTALGDTINAAERQRGHTALRRGQALVSGEDRSPTGPIRLQHVLVQVGPDGNATETVLRQVDAPTTRLAAQPQSGDMGANTILPEALARQLGSVTTVALVVGPGVTRGQETRLNEELEKIDNALYASAELGYDRRTPFAIVALAVVAGLVVLGGTLVARSLALVEARPDLATLTAVGAPPESARSVAGAYALVLALLGAALGIGAGLIPGIAVSIPLTRTGVVPGQPGPEYVVDVPWLMLTALLVLVPLVAAGAAAASRRQPSPGRPAA